MGQIAWSERWTLQERLEEKGRSGREGRRKEEKKEDKRGEREKVGGV